MSIVVSWNDFQQQDLDKVEIWRADSKVGVFAKAGETTTESTYTDATVERNRVYWYRLRAVKGADASDSVVFPLGYFPTTGPGPSDLKRGTWEFGYFGEVLPADVATFADLTVASGASAATGALTMYHKWVVNGRIVFFPNVPYHNNITIPNCKTLIPAVNVTLDNMLQISNGDNIFAVRTPTISNNVFNTVAITPAAGDDTLAVSEYAALSSMIMGADTLGVVSPRKFGDIPTLGYTSSNHYIPVMSWASTSASYGAPLWFVSPANASIAALTMTASRPVYLVLELVLE